MVLDELLKGESRNIEYKSELPKRSERYMKSVVAFANTGGGKRIIGILPSRNRHITVPVHLWQLTKSMKIV